MHARSNPPCTTYLWYIKGPQKDSNNKQTAVASVWQVSEKTSSARVKNTIFHENKNLGAFALKIYNLAVLVYQITEFCSRL